MTFRSYDKENLELVSKIIMDNLTPDLVAVKFQKRNSIEPLFGHCYHASAILYKIFGSKNVKLWHGKDDEEIWHWWIVDKDDKIIDLTSDQYYKYNRTPPYDNGKKAGLLGWSYRKKVKILLEKVEKVIDKCHSA